MNRSVFEFAWLLMDWNFVRAADNSGSTATDVSYCTLMATPSAFSGKRVRVRAVFRSAFEIQRIEPATCCRREGAKVWVEIEPTLEGRSLRLYRRFPKGAGVVLATFTGRFESGGSRRRLFRQKYAGRQPD